MCAAADNSCLLQIGGGLSRAGLPVRTDAPRRDPGGRSREGLSAGGARRAREPSAPPQPLASRRTPSGRSGPRWSAERADWEELREAGRALKDRVLRHLDDYLLQFEEAVERAGGHVHWARDGEEACRVVAGIVAATGEREVVKVKSLTTDEIQLNERLAAAGIDVLETDLAELICQLAGE